MSKHTHLGLIRASRSIRNTVTKTVFDVREYSNWIGDDIAGGCWASPGAGSEIALDTCAKELNEMGKKLIWLAKALEKRRFDLLQAGKEHNVAYIHTAK